MTARQRKPKELRNITRMDSPTFAGNAARSWWVRFKQKGQKVSKSFNDDEYGGKEQALAAAKLFRDTAEQLFESMPKVAPKMNRRNKSGIVNIYRGDKITRRKNGKTYTHTYWFASWTEKSGTRKIRAFAISKYGEVEAQRLALKTRDEAVARITGVKQVVSDWSSHPLNVLVGIVESATTAFEKGRSLEELAHRLFDAYPGFLVTDSRVQTETEEIDLIVLNNSTDPRWSRESALLLVECKNWSGRCGKNEFVVFKEKVGNRSSRCSLGFLISWNGFAETITKEMLRGSREETLVIPLDGNEIKKAIRDDNFEQVLIAAYHKAVTI